MGYRQRLLKIITFLGGIYFFLEFLLPAEIYGFRFGAYDRQISVGFTAVGAMALGLGLINIVMVHGGRLVFRRKDWVFSAALLLGLLSMAVIVGLEWRAAERINSEVQQVVVLSSFASAIVKDSAAERVDVPEVPVRTKFLLNALAQELEKVEKRLSKLDYSIVEESDPNFVVVQRYKTRIAERIPKIRQLSTQLRSELANASTQTHPFLATELSGLGQELRQLLQLLFKYSGVK